MEALGSGGDAGTGVDSGATVANGFSLAGLDVQAAARSTAAIATIVLEFMAKRSLPNVVA
jgi:hypothetical protein